MRPGSNQQVLSEYLLIRSDRMQLTLQEVQRLLHRIERNKQHCWSRACVATSAWFLPYHYRRKVLVGRVTRKAVLSPFPRTFYGIPPETTMLSKSSTLTNVQVRSTDLDAFKRKFGHVLLNGSKTDICDLVLRNS